MNVITETTRTIYPEAHKALTIGFLDMSKVYHESFQEKELGGFNKKV